MSRYSKNVSYVCGARYFKNATNTKHKAETKIWGRHTVASTAVLSRHGFEVSSSDLPFSFNHQNFYVMLDTKDTCVVRTQEKSVISAQSIVKEIISLDDPENIREDLHEMMLSFFMHHDNLTEEFKDCVCCSYMTLYNALKQMETLNTRRTR